MENYQVSARKYRPSQFEEVVGQAHITATLKNALKNQQLAQSFLFCGPRGVGKTTCARILAKTINCENPTENFEACDECATCTASKQSTSFNIFELDAASNNSVEDIRKLIEQVRFAPQSGKYKVYIIDEVHMLSSSAFNAFLKTLEEPPPYVIFIMATTEKHKLLPTILSRCQIFDFRRIGVNDIVEHLKEICKTEGIEAEEEALHVIGQKADGALRDALSIFDRIVSFSNKNIQYSEILNTLNILDYDYYFKITDSLIAQDSTQVMIYLDEILEKGFDGGELLNGLAQHFRSLLFSKEPQTASILEVSEQLQERYVKQSTLMSPSFLLSGLNITNDYGLAYKTSQNKRLQVELALLKLAYIQSALDVQKMVVAAPTNQVLKKKDSPAPIKVKEATPKPYEPIAATEQKVQEEIPKKEVVETPQKETKKEEEATIVESKEETKKEEKTVEQPSAKKQNLSLAEKRARLKGKAKDKATTLQKMEVIAEEQKGKTAEFAEKKTLTEHGLATETLQEYWNKFGKSLDSTRGQAAFKEYQPIIQNGMIFVKVGSRVDSALIREEGTRFAGLLSRKLNLKDVAIEVDVDIKKSEAIAKQVFTSDDKFKALVKKNPAIAELQQRLALALKY